MRGMAKIGRTSDHRTINSRPGSHISRFTAINATREHLTHEVAGHCSHYLQNKMEKEIRGPFWAVDFTLNLIVLIIVKVCYVCFIIKTNKELGNHICA